MQEDEFKSYGWILDWPRIIFESVNKANWQAHFVEAASIIVAVEVFHAHSTWMRTIIPSEKPEWLEYW